MENKAYEISYPNYIKKLLNYISFNIVIKSIKSKNIFYYQYYTLIILIIFFLFSHKIQAQAGLC